MGVERGRERRKKILRKGVHLLEKSRTQKPGVFGRENYEKKAWGKK